MAVPFTFTTALNHIFLPAAIDELLKFCDIVLLAFTTYPVINNNIATMPERRFFFISVYLVNEQVVGTDDRLEKVDGVHASAKEAVCWSETIWVDFFIRSVF